MTRRSRTILLAAIIAMLAGQAYSAEPTDKEIEQRQQAIDEAYTAAVDRTKVTVPTRTVDPWGTVREQAPSQKKSAPAAVDTKSSRP
jgi:hypothetical protein